MPNGTNSYDTSFAHPIEAVLRERYGRETWFDGIVDYLNRHINWLEGRMADSFWYTEVDPAHRLVYALEYSSVLREACLVFDSAVGKFMRATGSSAGEVDVWDEYRFLNRAISERFSVLGANIDLRKAALAIDNSRSRELLLFPFQSVDERGSIIMSWWTAHNKLKHSEIDNERVGTFENVLNALASIAFVYFLCSSRRTTLFDEVGILVPEFNSNEARALAFFQTW